MDSTEIYAQDKIGIIISIIKMIAIVIFAFYTNYKIINKQEQIQYINKNVNVYQHKDYH